MYCTACGTKLAGHDPAYCSSCGSPVADHSEAATVPERAASQPAHREPDDTFGTDPRSGSSGHPKGFYSDPVDPSTLRWWNGNGWGQKTSDARVPPQQLQQALSAAPGGMRTDVKPISLDPGYYTDPSEPNRQRRWNGTEWEPWDTIATPPPGGRDSSSNPQKIGVPVWAWLLGILIVLALAAIAIPRLGPSLGSALGGKRQVSSQELCMDAAKLYITTIGGPAFTEPDAVRKQAEAVQAETSNDPKVNEAAAAVVKNTLAVIDAVKAMQNALDPSTTWSQGADPMTQLDQATNDLSSVEKQLTAACPN